MWPTLIKNSLNIYSSIPSGCQSRQVQPAPSYSNDKYLGNRLNPRHSILPLITDINKNVKYYNSIDSINNAYPNVFILSMINRRKSMEDYFGISEFEYIFDNNVKKLTLYTVLDGHGGHQTASIAIQELPGFLFTALKTIDIEDHASVEHAITNAFLKFEETLINCVGDSGTTVIMVLDIGSSLYFVNLGDSRALYFAGTTQLFSTTDHKPLSEVDRIQQLGGFVTRGRINGIISVSRSIGDFPFLKYNDNSYQPEKSLVSSYPTVTKINKVSGSKIVLASDGLWDALSCFDVISILNSPTNTPYNLKQLYHLSQSRWSTDNTTIMIIQ